ncbi:DNA repair protein RecO [Candidatus Beckwithbacteria bacterium RIFCSPLOWO2_02_FULL_47_23]|uniref:DNA repair protein RecO n=2 Tax=Candidatus Beckwithiibacteriota TaxID=1752726 RepID=A0A1F5E387_9BACT|nr:MAG: DNA repair protein RecO [Candidatus Beckwithbacteria bacterium RIFCSPHIGHO2_12_FULL_47_17]OGD61818.1 MAG: DNA repair protein RecO [Candidatus Beckwithbacteria bacterium RIFCSPLOWO2_02_FULL_47_23]
MPGSYKTEAIVLKRTNFGEADRLVTVFSKHRGKLTLLAKGIRRLTSRKKGHLELFNRVKLQIANGKNLDIITEAETINSFPQLRVNLNRVRIAYLLLELVDKLTAENQEHEAVYALLCATLAQLNSDTASNSLIVDFEARLLTFLGFGLPARPDRASLEAHILAITEKPLNSKKLK